MKKTLLTIALMACAAVTFAQISKGSIMLGGDVGFQSNGTTTANSTTAPGVTLTNPPDGGGSTMNLGINAGYFLMDGMAVGLNFGYNSTSTKESFQYTDPSNNQQSLTWNNTTSLITIGLFARKYMMITEKFYFYGGIGFNYMTGTNSSSDANTSPPNSSSKPALVANPDEKISGWNIAIAPGLAYFPSPAWGIHFGLNNIISYSSQVSQMDQPVGSYTATQKVTTSGLNLGVGLTPTLGIAYFFGK